MRATCRDDEVRAGRRAVTTSVNAPSSRGTPRARWPARSPAVSPWSYARASRCATTSVSVSLLSSTPASSSSVRSAAKFSMMPLCTTATRPVAVAVRVGVAVHRRAVRGPAGVAHARGAGERVAAGGVEGGFEVGYAGPLCARRPASCRLRAPRLPLSRSRGTPCRRSPPSTTSSACRCPTYPTIPHTPFSVTTRGWAASWAGDHVQPAERGRRR